MWLFNFCRPPPTPPSPLPHLAVWRFFTSLFTFQLSCFQTYFYLATWSHNWHVNITREFGTSLRRFNFSRVGEWLIFNLFFYFCLEEITTFKNLLPPSPSLYVFSSQHFRIIRRILSWLVRNLILRASLYYPVLSHWGPGLAPAPALACSNVIIKCHGLSTNTLHATTIRKLLKKVEVGLSQIDIRADHYCYNNTQLFRTKSSKIFVKTCCQHLKGRRWE